MKKKSRLRRPLRKPVKRDSRARKNPYQPPAPIAPSVTGLPRKIKSGDQLLLRGGGLWLIHASGSEVREYKLRRNGDNVEAEHSSTVSVSGKVTALADSRYGAVIASSDGTTSDLSRLVEGRAHHVMRVDGAIGSIAGLGTSVFAATSVRNRLDGKLIEVDLYRRAIASERSIPSSRVQLNTDQTGSHLGVFDQTNRTFRVMSTRSDPCASGAQTGRTDRAPEAATSPLANPPGPAQGHPVDCCCCKKSDSPQPSSGINGTIRQNPPATQGVEPCHPSEGGVPTPDGGAVVGKGGRLGRYPRDGGQIDPCTADLMFAAASIAHAASSYVVADEPGRNFAIVSSTDMRILDQRQLGRAGGLILTDPSSPMVLLLNLANDTWDALQIDKISKYKDGLNHVPFVIGQDSVQFQGSQIMTLIQGHASGTGIVKVLILPVIEAGQTFHDPDLPNFAAYIARTAFPHVKDFYLENSFGKLTDIQYQIYGVDTKPGGPLALPRLVQDYYYPAYDPARIELTKKSVTFPYTIVFDGRESLKIHVQSASGGRPGADLTLNFPALLLTRDINLFPAQVSFAGTETAAIKLKMPDGTAKTLNLKFPARTVNINTEADIPGAFNDLISYLDGVFAAAEAVAKITPRLFSPPLLHRIKQGNEEFGSLVITLNHLDISGNRLDITSVTAGGPDPIGLGSAQFGHFTMNGGAAANNALITYLGWIDLIAQEDAGFDYTQRYLSDNPTVSTDVVADTLLAAFSISNNDGGIGATVTLLSSSGLEALYDSPVAVPNSATNYSNSNAARDLQELINDAFTAAVARQNPPMTPGSDKTAEDAINGYFAQFNMIAIAQIGQAINDPADPNTVQPAEMWNASAPVRRPGLRAVDWLSTGVFAGNKNIQFKTMWNFLFLDTNPDFSVMCHELGHAIGFRDLYKDANFRDDLAYLGTWSVMDDNAKLAHHAAYHKWESGWLDHFTTVGLAAPGATLISEVLLVPLEHWDDSLLTSAPAAFGTDPNDVPVTQMVFLDLGGDGAVVDIIEARQKGTNFSQHLDIDPAILITNALQPWDDNRYAFEGKYRREVHLLNPDNILSNPGDSFDLAKAKEFSAKGIVVEVVDRKPIDGIEVFRIKVTRENTAFIDLYFASADPYYKNPDLWVDWAGDNGPGGGSSTNPDDHHKFPLGQPVDQGEQIHVPDTGTELHWIVARIRNRGQIQAEEVKFNFQVCIPPGGGDKSNNFQMLTSVTVPVVAGGDVPLDVVARWDVPAGFSGHNCLLVEIADYKIPQDADGSALASDDVWQANNWAQKNVDQFVPVHGSPYEPVEFDFGVNNDGLYTEVAYLEPDNLPYGMSLTVTPSRRTIPPRTKVLFRCKLELDENIIDAGCRNDREFDIVVWRVEGDTTVKWGGVHYKVRPRNKSVTQLTGYWNDDKSIQLSGSVTTDPGGGIVHVRFAFDGLAAEWMTAPIMPGGGFILNTTAPVGTGKLDSIALYEGSTLLAPSRSVPLILKPPPPIN
jgi:M6 family metalloprotease-like protein